MLNKDDAVDHGTVSVDLSSVLASVGGLLQDDYGWNSFEHSYWLDTIPFGMEFGPANGTPTGRDPPRSLSPSLLLLSRPPLDRLGRPLLTDRLPVPGAVSPVPGGNEHVHLGSLPAARQSEPPDPPRALVPCVHGGARPPRTGPLGAATAATCAARATKMVASREPGRRPRRQPWLRSCDLFSSNLRRFSAAGTRCALRFRRRCRGAGENGRLDHDDEVRMNGGFVRRPSTIADE